MKSFICSTCKATAQAKKFPPRWKKVCGKEICRTCAKNYSTWAISIPVSGPESSDQWPALREAVILAWRQSRELSNWAVTELAKADVVRSAGEEKMPKFVAPYLYPGARERIPDLPCEAVTAILSSVQRKYLAQRYERIWLGKVSLPSYKYPTPYPLASQAVKIFEQDGRFFVSLRFGSDRFSLRLAGGPGQQYWYPQLRQLVNGEAALREVAVVEDLGHDGDNRGTVADRKPGGGDRRPVFRIGLKIVGLFPRRQKRSGGTMTLARGIDSFCVAHLPEREPWILNADHIRSRIFRHRVYLQRMAQDTKYEKRWPKRRLRQMNEARAERCAKHQNRIDSFIDESTAAIVGYAVRNCMAKIEYNQTETPFLGKEFPWFAWAEKLKQKCEREGLELIVGGSPDADDGSEGPSAGESAGPARTTQGDV